MKLTFSTQTEVMFDYRGVTELASGTAPHNPAEARIVVQNVSIGRVSGVDDAACSAAADAGEAELAAWVSEHCQGGDERARRNLAFATEETSAKKQ